MIRRMPGTLTTRQVDLLDRLTDLVVAEGFAHLTLDDLAARLRCSKTTLYALAPSKDQLAVRVVNNFFRRSTAFVESRVAQRRAPLRRTSRQFIDDIAGFEPTRTTYRDNAVAAARRVRELVDEAAAEKAVAPVDAAFVATWVGVTIEAIQRGDFAERAELSDAAAFQELSRLVSRALLRD